MSLDNLLGSVSQISNTASGGLNTVKRLAADLGLGGVGGAATYWKDSLRPASFRGVPFAVKTAEGNFGRRNAIHEYPFRDEIWVEDMGRAARRIHVTGFLVENGVATPGAVIDQRNRMISAAETGGETTLVLPTYGEMKISLLDFKCSERWDLGRVVELTFVFAESGKRLFPQSIVSTTDAVNSAATAADAAAGTDWMAKATSYLKSGISAVQQAVNVVQKYTTIAQRTINGATNLFHLAQTLAGQFGRFSGLSSSNSSASLSDLVASAAVSRQGVASSITAAQTSAAALSPTNASGHPAAIQAVVAAVLAASPSPADALTSMASIATLPGGTGISGASGDLTRRAAIVAMARASALYQPTSYDDASSVRTSVAGYLDDEILIAADQGEDATYQALRTLRTAVVQDLTQRGATLATVTTVISPMPVPALVLAQRLYRDPSREDELITEAMPVHPLFMPTQFQALAV